MNQHVMPKFIFIYLYGAFIILEGIFLLYSQWASFATIRLTLGISLFIGSVFAFLAARLGRRSRVQFAYHLIHAIAMLVYSLTILLFCHSLEILTFFTAFLLFFYAVSEIIFCTLLFNMGHRLIFRIIAVRAIIALLVGLGTVAVMSMHEGTIEVFGILFVLLGLNVIFYAPVVKSLGQRLPRSVSSK